MPRLFLASLAASVVIGASAAASTFDFDVDPTTISNPGIGLDNFELLSIPPGPGPDFQQATINLVSSSGDPVEAELFGPPSAPGYVGLTLVNFGLVGGSQFTTDITISFFAADGSSAGSSTQTTTIFEKATGYIEIPTGPFSKVVLSLASPFPDVGTDFSTSPPSGLVPAVKILLTQGLETTSVDTAVIPLPASLPLMVAGLLAWVGLARAQKRSVAA